MTLDELIQDPVFRHFHQICQIPHGSGNERALGRYIVSWARSLHLEAEIDSTGNVLIRKPARKDAPWVLLQAHMDMVCETQDGYDHDFTKDPIPWSLDGDFLSTGQKTSLGADDGIGMALAMALLEDSSPDLPSLEVLFTVSEEDDFKGASRFDTTSLHASIMINLDHIDEHELVCGSSGGMEVFCQIPIARSLFPNGNAAIHCEISGLRGGHSGEDIHRGRGNAIILLARCLDQLSKEFEFSLASLDGGHNRLSIPRSAEATICIPEPKAELFSQRFHEIAETLQHEFTVSSARIRCNCANTATYETAASLSPILSALMLIPDGIFQMNESLEGLVDASDNLGEVHLKEDFLELTLELRAAYPSAQEYIFRKIQRLTLLLHGFCEARNSYPSWIYNPGSPLADLCCQVHRNRYGTEMERKAVHAGLEVGYFQGKLPALDAVSLGPNIFDLHSVYEHVDITSVHRFYYYLLDLLAAISKGKLFSSGEFEK